MLKITNSVNGRRSGVFIVNLEQMLHLFQVLTLLTLNIHLFDGQDLKSHDLRSIKNQRFAGVQ